MSASCRIVWELAGSPEITAPSVAKLITDTPGVCAICGHRSERTAVADRALGANFSDRGHLTRFTEVVCPACLWCCSGKPPTSLRMWSIIAAPGMDLPPSNPKAWLQGTPGLMLFNRSNPGPLAALLADPPLGQWCASVAYSGQKHVLPYTPINTVRGEWTIRAEDHYVTATPGQWQAVHAAALGLRRLGVPADDVLAGAPRYLKTRSDLTRWSELDRQLSGWHNSPILSLALWTITKETMT